MAGADVDDAAEDTRTPLTVEGIVVPAALLVLGVWGLLAPYVGPLLGFVITTLPLIEVVDHIVPAVVILAVAAYGLARRQLGATALMLVGLGAVWMTGTHVPLVVQALQGGAPLPASLFHSLPGALILMLAVAAFVGARPVER